MDELVIMRFDVRVDDINTWDKRINQLVENRATLGSKVKSVQHNIDDNVHFFTILFEPKDSFS
ncbi:MAG: hypothetical protein JWP57_313 [Spirosoma sp.]|nr:hypothetical protein [Spirosoma sp.]